MSNFEEFPKMLYLHGDVTVNRTVNSAEEEEALGENWIDAPVDPLASVAKVQTNTIGATEVTTGAAAAHDDKTHRGDIAAGVATKKK